MLWFIAGLVTGAVVLTLILSLRGQRALRWYEWLIGVVGAFLAYFAVQSLTESLAEMEPRAAWLLLLMFGLPAAILLAVDILLVRRRLGQLPAGK